MALLVKNKDVVVPGEALADGMDYLPGSFTYRLGEKIVAKRVGLVEVEGRAVKLIPLSGRYLPKVGDKVIGQVYDITLSGWLLKINSAYNCMLSMKDIPRFVNRNDDLSRFFDVGDYIRVKVVKVSSQNVVDVTLKEPGLMKLGEGRVITISPTKVPRVIGKQGSMVSLVKEKTGCNITVGQNGVVWIKGEPQSEIKAVKAIRMIEEQAHIEGLTDRVTAFLEEK